MLGGQEKKVFGGARPKKIDSDGEPEKIDEWVSKGEGEFNWVWLTRVNSERRVIGVHNPDCQGVLQPPHI